MKQRITVWAILRRSFLVVCAVFCFAGLFGCSDESATVPSLSDIFAHDVSAVYDGRPHSVSIVNTLPTDTVTYSADNIVFSTVCPAFSEVGDYTVYFKVLRDGYAEFSSSASVSISPCVLSDISASDLSFVYDGLSHPIVIDGVLSSDDVTYSTDGISFSSSVPSFTDVGVYTVYYRVQRSYGDYKSSCSVTVLPDIYGRYFNPDYGILVISDDVSFSVSGTGFINDLPFSVTDNVLSYNSLTFSLLSDDDYVYRLSVSNSSVYFRSSASGTLSVSFKDDIAEIKSDEDILLSLQGFNYCESGIITDYNTLCFTQAFSSSDSAITDISVELSLRALNPVTLDDVYCFTYDGLPHSLDFLPDDVIYTDGTYSFTDIGSYTVPVVFTSSLYLPKLLICTVVILPDIDGVFVSSEHVIRISDNRFFLDGVLCGELSVLDACRAFDGLPIAVTDVGIVYDGTTYASVDSPVLAVYVDGVYCSCFVFDSDVLYLHVSYADSVLSFTDIDDVLLLVIPLSCDGIALSVNDTPMTALDDSSFLLGPSDIRTPVVVVRVSSLGGAL